MKAKQGVKFILEIAGIEFFIGSCHDLLDNRNVLPIIPGFGPLGPKTVHINDT